MKSEVYESGVKTLPGEIYTALKNFKGSKFAVEMMGAENHRKFAELKKTAADRSPRALGTRVKCGEVLFHHEITNQMIWSGF